MSEDFLRRWSRRKAAAKAEPPPEAPREEEAVKPEAQPEPAAEGTAEEVDLSALPPLDSITSTTDITAFLRKGVPEALRTAALRKMWTSDPAIRDFIGLSENSWDFNDPGSIPGFGPLEMSADQVRQMAAELVGDVQKLTENVQEVVQKAAGQQDDDDKLKTAETEHPNPPTAVSAAQQKTPAASQQNGTSESDAKPVRRNHGGALPG
jgi:Protein of unknown function (DUF3306)